VLVQEQAPTKKRKRPDLADGTSEGNESCSPSLQEDSQHTSSSSEKLVVSTHLHGSKKKKT
jgi:hypothetical protein